MTGQDTQNTAGTDGLDLTTMLEPVLRHKGRLAARTALWTAVILLVGLHLTPTFTSTGSVYVEDKPALSAMGAAPTNLSAMLGNTGDVLSQKDLLRSDSLSLAAIEACGFNARLSGPSRLRPQRPFFWQWRIGRDTGRYLRGLFVHQTRTAPHVYQKVSLDLRFEADGQFIVADHDSGLKLGQGRLGQPVVTPRASFILDHHDATVPEPDTRLKLVIRPAGSVLEKFSKKLEVQATSQLTTQSKVIRVSFTDRSPFLAREAVTALLADYTALKTRWADELSEKVGQFATRQLDQMLADVRQSQSRLAAYQTESGVIALDEQVRLQIQSLVQQELALREQKLRLYELQQLVEGLRSGQTEMTLPSFVEDPLLQSMGQRLTQVNAEAAALRSQFREDYPPLVSLQSARKTLVSDMAGAMTNYLERANMRVTELEADINQFRSGLTGMPEKAQAWMDYERAARIYENLWAKTAEMRHQVVLSQANTLMMTRSVDEPMLPLREAFPRLSLLAAVSLLGGLVLATGLEVRRHRRLGRPAAGQKPQTT
ncbi:MAG: hypothetical protein IT442_02545 [Phycisphaeraceae bacterium]|nr:hypothetical protein [Phycisphaeraceae bacterium]